VSLHFLSNHPLQFFFVGVVELYQVMGILLQLSQAIFEFFDPCMMKTFFFLESLVLSQLSIFVILLDQKVLPSRRRRVDGLRLDGGTSQ